MSPITTIGVVAVPDFSSDLFWSCTLYTSVGCACEDEEPSGGWECGHHQHDGLQPNCSLCVLTLLPANTTIMATRPATSTTAKAARPARRRRVWPSPGPPAFAAAMMGGVDALVKL